MMLLPIGYWILLYRTTYSKIKYKLLHNIFVGNKYNSNIIEKVG